MEKSVHIDDLLKCAKAGNVPHAILLESENLEYCFKISQELVKTLLCRSIVEDEDKIRLICEKVDKCIHPDVFVLECEGKSKTIGVNQVRELKQTVYVRPNESDYKIYIIRDCSTLTVQAQNALLKILEEPPKYAVFVLMCENANVLLGTVLSRVQKFFIELSSKDNGIIITDDIKKIVTSFLSKNEITIMESTSNLVKDRKLFKDTICSIIDIFSKAALVRDNVKVCGDGEPIELYEKIYDSMTIKQIMEFIKLFKYCYFLLESNVNINLVVSYFSYKAREVTIL